MKYAIIADVHGNMPALKLVLEDAQKRGAESYLLAGDYSIRAPWFNDVIPTLRSLHGWIVCPSAWTGRRKAQNCTWHTR